MNDFDFSYLPKGQSITYMDVNRKSGHVTKTIHMHDHHEMVLVTSVAFCGIINNGNKVNIHTPAVFINRAGSFHEVSEITEGIYESRVVFFHPKALSEIPRSMLYEKQLFSSDLLALPMTEEQVREMTPLFELLKTRSSPQKLPLLLCILAQMSQLMNECVSPLSVTAVRSYIFDLIELLRDTEREKHTLARLAEQFHVSQTKLKTDFKQITGMPVNVFRNHARLQKSLALLESTQMEQAQIACICGFTDESYYIRAFRKKYGLTPGAYRKQIKSLCSR